MLAAETMATKNAFLTSEILQNLNKPKVTVPVGMALEDIERVFILETLKDHGFNRTKTAKTLCIGIRTLQRKLKQYKDAGFELAAWPLDEQASRSA